MEAFFTLLMVGYNDIIERCKKKDAKAQRILYDLFKSRLMGLCKRYARNTEEAQDILQEAFIKIFLKINKLESPEKLESWMITITVRTAIDQYNKTKTHDNIFSKIIESELENISDSAITENVNDEFLISLINNLPDGCRLVFNLFALEGYSHAEIANLLNIAEGTSRSQLHHAKYLLKEKLKCHSMASYYEK